MSLLFEPGLAQRLERDETLVTAAPISIHCIFKLLNLTTMNVLAGYFDASVGNHFFRLAYNGVISDRLEWSSQGGGGQRNAAKTGGQVGVWHFGLGVEIDSSNRQCFLDGVGGSVGGLESTPLNIDRLSIGRSGDSSPSGHHQGLIYEIAIWRADLTVGGGRLAKELALGADPRDIEHHLLVHHFIFDDEPVDTVSNTPLSSTLGAAGGTVIPGRSVDMPHHLNRRRKRSYFLVGPPPIFIAPDAAVLNLNVPTAAVNQQVRPTPAVLNLNLPAAAVNRQVRPTPTVLNLNVPAAAVNRLLLPDPAILTLNVPTHKVNQLVTPDSVILTLNVPAATLIIPRTVTPDPAVLNLNLPAATVNRLVAPTPAVLNLNVPTAMVNRVVLPTPAILSLNVPTAMVNRIIGPSPAILNLNSPAITVIGLLITLLPDPVQLNLAVPTHRVNRLVRPAPATLALNVPTTAVNRLVRPTPAILNLNSPAITVDAGPLVVQPAPAVLGLIVRPIIIGGIEMPPFLVQLDPESATARFNETNSVVVFAASAADARAMAKSLFGGDSDAAWDAATVTEISAATDLLNWKLRVRIFDTTGAPGSGQNPIEVEVMGVASDLLDDLGLAMAAALNATPPIANALYTVGTNVLRVAQGSTDALGDREITVDLLPPGVDAVPVPGGVVSITDQGASSADLSGTLAADTFVIPLVTAQAKRTD